MPGAQDPQIKFFDSNVNLFWDDGEDIVLDIDLKGIFGWNRHACMFYGENSVPGDPRIEVDIDIKPGSDPNSINVNKKKGVTPVAILTTSGFDAATVDPDTVRFGPDQAGPAHWPLEDVDEDGDPDMILYFKTQDTGIEVGTEEACLIGLPNDGTCILGCDSVRTVPPGP